MKLAISVVLLVAVMLFPLSVSAAPFKAENNPNIVANHPTGPHGIPGEPYLHEGADVVMRAGQSGNFQQWFVGDSEEPGDGFHGDHSLWKSVPEGTECKEGETLVVTSQTNFWGDYLSGSYCVKTNDFLNGQE